MLYWAYGSNLSPINMRQRCPDAKRVGPLLVDTGLLVFRGVADVMSTGDESDFVQGGVWRLTRACERALDAYEGVASGFYKKKYLKLRVKGVKEDCLYYQMNSRYHSDIMPPTETYLNKLIDGYKFFELDLNALDAAVRHSWDNKNKTPFLRDRHARKGSPRLATRDAIKVA